MKCGYQEAIQENKKIISVNALRNEINSYWRQLEEEGKEEVKHDYQLAYDNYLEMDNLIKKIEMFLRVFIQNYNHCENNPCTCKRINDVGLALIRSIYCKTDRLNPFPNKPWFLRVAVQDFLKTLQEKEKLLIMNNFSFSHSVFYQIGELSAIFTEPKTVVCKLFQF